MNIEQFFAVIKYKIDEGSKFEWNCFGPNARFVTHDCLYNDDLVTISAIFDTETHNVYRMELHDGSSGRSYLWEDKDFREVYIEECHSRGIIPEIAYADDSGPVEYISLEVENDILSKASNIVDGKPYDTRIQIEVDIDDDLMLSAMRMAHELDITFNQFVEQILSGYIDTLEREDDPSK